ncbi:MAG TPA: hypothetical protein VF746_19575 [Longimicrobium sp.]|jgi:hypothetical protein
MPVKKPSQWRSGWLWLLLVVGVLGACYGIAGYALTASFSVADPPGSPSREGAAIFFVAVAAISVVLTAAAFVALLLRWAGPPADDARATR